MDDHPPGVKIEIKARLVQAQRLIFGRNDQRSAAAHLRFAIAQLETVDGHDLAAEVERWPRVA